jgi:hypothetical protein
MAGKVTGHRSQDPWSTEFTETGTSRFEAEMHATAAAQLQDAMQERLVTLSHELAEV